MSLKKLKLFSPIFIIAVFLFFGFGFKISNAQAVYYTCWCRLEDRGCLNASNWPADSEQKGGGITDMVGSAADSCQTFCQTYGFDMGFFDNPVVDHRADLACTYVANEPVAASPSGIPPGKKTTGAGGIKRSYCWKGNEVCRIIFADGDCPSSEWEKKETPACGCGPNGAIIKQGEECIPLDNPLLNEVTEIPTIIGIIIKAALGIIGAITLLMFVWGGTTLVTSAGNPEKIKKGSSVMLWAAIGVLVVFGSYLIVNLLITFFVK